MASSHLHPSGDVINILCLECHFFLSRDKVSGNTITEVSNETGETKNMQVGVKTNHCDK